MPFFLKQKINSNFNFYFSYLFYFLAGNASVMYYNTSAMQDHLKRKHKIKVETIPRSSDPERFKCSHCLKVFKKSRALKDHINTHTGNCKITLQK